MIRHLVKYLPLLIAASIGACDDFDSGSADYTNNKVRLEYREYRSEYSSCPTTKAVYLVNSSEDERTVEVRMVHSKVGRVVNPSENKIWSVTDEKRIGVVEGGRHCDERTTYQIVDEKSAALFQLPSVRNINFEVRQIRMPPALQMLNSGSTVSAEKCFKSCLLDTSNGNCNFQIHSASSEFHAFTRETFLNLLPESSEAVISKTDFQSKFNQSEDACHRGDILIFDNEFSNTGLSCEAEAQANIVGLDTTVSVFFDEMVSGVLEPKNEIDGVEYSSIRFPTAAQGMRLSLSRRSLNAAVGGSIRRIDLVDDGSVFTTDNGCIGVFHSAD